MTEYEVTSDTYENPGVFVTILKFITIKNVDQIGYPSVLIFKLGSWLTSNFSTMYNKNSTYALFRCDEHFLFQDTV